MQIPTEATPAEDLAWGIATAASVVLIVALLPLCAAAWACRRLRG